MPAPKKLVKKTRKISLPIMRASVSIKPKTLNKEKRTVEVIFTEGARVLRRGFFQDFFMELGLKKENFRMERFESGRAPVLDNHGDTSKRGIESQLGVIQSAHINEDENGVATLRFSKRESLDDFMTDIEDGIVSNISFGFNIFAFEKVGEEDNLDVFRTTDIEPLEISVVPAGADQGARIRSNETQTMTDCIITEMVEDTRADEITEPDLSLENKNVEKKPNIRDNKSNGGFDMTPEELKALQEKVKAEAKAEGIAEGIADENKRALEIRSIVKKVNLKDELADEYIKDGKSIDEVRTLVIDAIAAKDKKPENQTDATNIDVGEDNARKARIEGMTSAILHKYRPKKIDTRENGQKIILPGYELNEQGREYAYLSLADMAKVCLEGMGVRTNMMPKHQIVDAALNNVRSVHSTSDFPEILANTVNRTLRDGYLAAPKTWEPFTNEVFVSDFRQISRTNLGDAPKLELVGQGSEVKRGTISEAAEKYQVEEFAKILAFSRKTIINDDMEMLTKIPTRMGRRASDLESDTVWDIIKANAALSDTFALYSSQHSNLSTAPGAPSEVLLNEARAAMRRQLGLDGAEISIIPVWLIVPPAHETIAEKLVAVTRPNNASDVNPFGPNGRTTLRLDVEPRLETGSSGSLTAWFLFADKGQVDMVELARLEGTDGPQIQTRDGFDVAGVEIKIMHDIGAKAIDFRGVFKNAGA